MIEEKYIESKISETILKKKRNEEKRNAICYKNNLLCKFIASQKDKSVLFTYDPWNDTCKKEKLKNFLMADKHIETIDDVFGMNKLFIYNFLYNYELNDIPKHVSDYMINLLFKDVNKDDNSSDLSSSSIKTENNNDYEIEDENEIEKEYFNDYKKSQDIEIENDFNDFIENEHISSKILNLTSKIEKKTKDMEKSINSNLCVNSKIEKQNNLISEQKILDSTMESALVLSNINKLKQSFNDENIELTREKIINKKNMIENFFSQNNYIDKKIEILRYMKSNNIECFTSYDFEVTDENGHKLISEENIEKWYQMFKNLDNRKKNIFNPSLLIISAVLFSIEYGSKYFNIKEFEGISKNFSEKTVPQDLISTKEYLDEHIINKIPENPIFDFGIYLIKTFFEKKFSI